MFSTNVEELYSQCKVNIPEWNSHFKIMNVFFLGQRFVVRLFRTLCISLPTSILTIKYESMENSRDDKTQGISRKICILFEIPLISEHEIYSHSRTRKRC